MARRALLGLLLAVLLLALAAGVSMPRGEGQLLAHDDGPAGLSQARRAVLALPQPPEVATIVSTPGQLAGIADPSGTMLLIAGTERTLTDGEAEAVAAYQQRGGALLVLTKNPATSTLLARYGVEVDGREVLDDTSGTGLVTVRAQVDHQEGRHYELALVRPTSLGLRPNWTGGTVQVLANTSADAVIDVDGDGNVTPALDIAASFPLVVLSRPFEGGPVLVVADPVAFTNARLATADNRAFLLAAIEEHLPGGGTIYVDDSRHAQQGAYALEWLRAVTLLAKGPVGWVALAAALVAAGIVLVRHKGLAAYGHTFAPEPLVAVPTDEEGARDLLRSDADEAT